MPGARLWLWCLWLLGLGVTRVAAAECQLGTVIVASVFVTLGVVAIVLGIVLLVIWKRNRGCFICPKHTRKASSLQEEPPATQYHVNPAFVDSDSLVDAEEGIIGLTPKKGLSPEKKSPIRDGYKKTWASLPSPDFPDGLHRHVSCGSLDDNFRHMGPEVVSVWLQSQDIIGLGFNISGNMRDGIYVSQVHNRGPAIESGKIKVGDRIVSVTIAYENIVYEDALTILSYASPYPVKVTVQKERSGSSDPHSGSSEQLKHPIYRSQSLDALQRIKDPAFRPKRSQSEMKTETRKESDKRQRPADRKSKGLSQTYSSPPLSTVPSRNEVTADVMVHMPNFGYHDGQEGGWSLSGKDTVDHAAAAAMLAESPVSANFQKDDTEGKRRSRLDTEAARQYADLMDQVRDGKKKDTPVDSVFQNPALRHESMSPKLAPSKPERKKKASNSSLVLFEPEQVRLEVEDVKEIVPTAAATTAQAFPRQKNKDNDPEPEADEEQILQSFVERNVVIDSKNIAFSLVETADPMTERLRPEDAFANVRMAEWVRPASPEQEAVEEELMEARVATRDAQALSLPSDTRQGGNNRVPRKEEPKVRQLDDGMLERLIAMNAFPPGTQGWVGIQAGAEKGGVYDEFVPLAMQQPLLFGNGYANSTPPPSSTTRQPRGLAFEVRDDVITGVPINVPLHKPRNGARRNSSNSSNGSSNSSTGWTNRRSSADAVNSDSEELRAYIVRANSMREELERQRQRRGEEVEDERHALDWSGTRLVRSGSFPEIPQDDSVSDWTDNNVIGDGDEDDSVSGTPALLGVDRVEEGVLAHNMYSAREDLTNISDLTSSASSSRSASPAVTNGPACVITQVLSGPAALKAGTVIDLTPHLDNNANTKSISVSASTNDDMDC